jgi:transcription elongation factor GreA
LESNATVTLLDAVGLYIGSLRKKERQSEAQQQILRFVNWCGSERIFSRIEPSAIEEYGEQAIGMGGGDHAVDRLKEVKKFLAFAKKKGLTEQNLSQHLRIRRGKVRSRHRDTTDQEIVRLSPDGHGQLVVELEKLKAERGPIAAEIKRAAADKDVRENVPLEAAREQLGHVESRINQIEYTLKVAVVVDPKLARGGQSVRLGSNVQLKDLNTNRQSRYMLVSALEANPLEGKISDVSPVGKALMKHIAGEEVEVETPRGKQRYSIIKVSS